MKLLITTLTMIFISFGALGAMFLQYQEVDDKLCFEAFTEGKILYSADNNYLAFYKNIYSFKARFINQTYLVNECVRIENP